VKLYRMTRRVNRTHYGAWEVGAIKTKVTTKRGLRATLKAEREYGGGQPTMTTVKVEEAEVSNFVDVSAHWLRLCGMKDGE
jgi:bisphosphoglycerate-dependent phosphoglycerate mutase